MAIVKVAIIAVIGWACHSVAAQEKVCSAFCSSLGMLQTNPGKSCDDIYQINKASRGVSGNYWINTTTGVHQVYCDMELECGGHKGGWMRIADLDTTRGDDCPSGWTHTTQPPACLASISDINGGCRSAIFSTLSISYSKICGMAIGYQRSQTDGFAARNFPSQSIDGPYVDGISITYGSTPRKHVWTYAIGHTDRGNIIPTSNCPCSEFPGTPPPSFVHENYYCESGYIDNAAVSAIRLDDPVWDGDGCFPQNSCCSDPSLPWFYRQIPLTASEDIEARICRDEGGEEVLVRDFQLYVQ